MYMFLITQMCLALNRIETRLQWKVWSYYANYATFHKVLLFQEITICWH